MGSWWIKDGIDGRRIEAQGFAAAFDLLSNFDWSQDHGDSDVLEKDFVVTAGYDEKTEKVDCLQMSSHGNTDGFACSDAWVTTSDSINFGAGDLELWASHACQVLRHESGNSVGRWIHAFERLHYMCGFHTNSYSGGGQTNRGYYFAYYGGVLHYLTSFFSHYTIRGAWKKANRLVEGSNVRWAYLRAEGETSGGSTAATYNERITPSEPPDPVQNRTFWTANGQC
jgi:hypothetical protein